MESSHQGDGQPSSSASVNSQEQDFSKCPWNMRQESASVKPELQDEAWAEQWAAELGVKEEPQDEAWAAQWAAELWEEGVKEEPQDEAWAADWAAEIWEKDEKAWYAVKEEPQVEAGKNGGEVKEAPHDEVVKEEPQDEAWAADWAAEIWEKKEKKVRWWDTCFALAHVSVKFVNKSLSRLCVLDHCLFQVLLFPLGVRCPFLLALRSMDFPLDVSMRGLLRRSSRAPEEST